MHQLCQTSVFFLFKQISSYVLIQWCCNYCTIDEGSLGPRPPQLAVLEIRREDQTHQLIGRISPDGPAAMPRLLSSHQLFNGDTNSQNWDPCVFKKIIIWRSRIIQVALKIPVSYLFRWLNHAWTHALMELDKIQIHCKDVIKLLRKKLYMCTYCFLVFRLW